MEYSENKDYYQQSAMQPIEVMQAIMTPEQFKGFLLGNIIKYRMRAGCKGDYEGDLKKARVYAAWLKMYNNGFTIKPGQSSEYVPEYQGIV